MILRLKRLTQVLTVAAAGVLAVELPAYAVPSFAAQTGQPCTACHVGAFGPQLTGFGRAFKIAGYTQAGGEGWQSKIPLAGFVQTSFTHTSAGQNPPPTYFSPNDNPALDQISLFLAGRINEYSGALIQTTYSGSGKTTFVDNSDIRITAPVDIGDTNLRVGLSFNNGPTVQDPFNSSLVWGPPYQGSSLVPGPVAEPLIVSNFQGKVLGLTAYAWYDNAMYLEFGGYETIDNKLAKTFGQQGVFGNTVNVSPYVRLAYELDWGGQTAHVGLIGMQSAVQPGQVPGFGTDKYTDITLDGSYQWTDGGDNIVTVLSSLTHEQQKLDASFAQGLSANGNNTLNEFRTSVTYFYQNTYGGSLAVKRIWGTTDPGLYNDASGAHSGSPNTTALIAEADYVPFGKDDSWGAPLANVKLGVQYTYYPQFNGSSTNYDGAGRSANGNNTVYAFAWFAF